MEASSRIMTEKYNSEYAKKLTPKVDLGMLVDGTVVIKSGRGTGNAYTVWMFLLQARLVEKEIHYRRKDETRGAKVPGSERSINPRPLDEFLALDEEGRPFGSVNKNKGAERRSPAEVEELGELDRVDAERALDGDITEGKETSAIDYGPAGPFEANKAMFKILKGDDYIDPKALRMISETLDGIMVGVEHSIMWVTSRRSNARENHTRYGGLFPGLELHPGEEGTTCQARLIISIESLLGCFSEIKYDYIVLEGVTSIMARVYSPDLAQSGDNTSGFERLMREARSVISMDTKIT